MTTIEELNELCPEHDRTSCTDENPVNYGIDYRYGKVWCRRCQGLWTIKAQGPSAECWRKSATERFGKLAAMLIEKRANELAEGDHGMAGT